MPDDPIVEEVRRAGQAFIDSFGGDRKALIAAINRRAEQAGQKVVSFPPRPAKARPQSRIRTRTTTDAASN